MPDRKHLIKTLLLVILLVFGAGIVLVFFLWNPEPRNPGPEIVVEGAEIGRTFHLPPEYGEAALTFDQTTRTAAFLEEIRQCCKDYPELMRTWTSEAVKITIDVELSGKVRVIYAVPVFSLRYTAMNGIEYHTGEAPQFPEVNMEVNKRNEKIVKRVEEFLRRKIEELAKVM